MKKAAKKWVAAALAAAMTLSMAASQAVGAASLEPGNPAAVSGALAALTDAAIANSRGLGNEPNSLIELPTHKNTNFYINTFSGNLTLPANLYQCEEYPPMELTLTYNSQDSEDYGFGPGFLTNFHSKILYNADGSRTLIDPTGTQFVFRDGDTIVTPSGKSLGFLYEGDGTMMFMEGVTYTYDQYGRLDHWISGGIAHSYSVFIHYNEDGSIDSVVPSYIGVGNRKIVFEYGTPEEYGRRVVTRILCYEADPETPPTEFAFSYGADGLASIPYHLERPLVLEHDPVTQAVTGIHTRQISYLEGNKVASVKEEYIEDILLQFLYGNGQTAVLQDGKLTLRQFDENGNWINP